MGNVIQLFENLYGECPDCGCDTFLLLMDENEEMSGVECCECREVFYFEGTGISFELDGG